MKTAIKNIHLYNWYYLLVIVGYILTLATSKMRPGILASILMVCIVAELLFKRRIRFGNTVDYLVLIYFIYNLLSGIWLVASGMPVSVYLQEFSNSALPIIFYLVGKTVKGDIDKFYRLFIYAVLLVCFVGLILYVTAPQFYLQYVYDMQYISDTDASTMRIRMISVIGPTLLGALAAAGMLASAYFIVESRGKKGKILFFLNLFFAFMSNMRSAMVVSILVLLYMNYLVFFTFHLMEKKYFFIECAVLAAGFVLLCAVYNQAVMKIYYRLVSLPGAIGQRSDQWVGAVNNMYSKWLGNGLGANGHKAIGYTKHVIADGSLVKIYCEMGILGTSVFIYILLLLITKGIVRLRECAVELGIIAVVLLQSVGSNILAFQLAAPIFWFAAGRCAWVIYERERDTQEKM